jgi:MFS transporter, ACS family, DAL5 transporter family protein
MEKNELNSGDPVQTVDSYNDNEKYSRHLNDSASDDAILSEFTKSEEKKIMHRIDRRLVLTVGFMYCISLMDRTNLSAANIAG